MRKELAGCAAVLLLGLASPAAAETFRPAPNMNFKLHFGAKEGQFSKLEISDLGRLTALRTRAGFTWFGQHERWAPSFKIQLADGNEELMVSAGGRDRFLEVKVEAWRDQKRLTTQLLNLSPEAKEPIMFWLFWTPEGVVTAVAAVQGEEPQKATVKLARAPTKATLVVSTASVAFDPVEFGTGSP